MSETSYKDLLNKDSVPHHVAIIMDGNGRWAKDKGEHRVFGHLNGVESVRAALTAASEIGVKQLTLYAFSTENWNRPKEEVDALMNLLVRTIVNELAELNKNEVRLNAIGNLKQLPADCLEVLAQGIEATKGNTRIQLNLALSYSSRNEIFNAVKDFANDYKNGTLNEADFSEDLFESYLLTKGIPDPDLLIRTSGEQRISNFLLWQIAYTELYFTEAHWPAFTKEEFFKAIYTYQSRERRFGLTSEQLSKS